MLNNFLPCVCLPYTRPAAGGIQGLAANRREFFAPLENPASCSGDEAHILMGVNPGFNTPVRAFPLECQDPLTGFTFCFIEGKILLILCGGLDGTGGEEGPWSL